MERVARALRLGVPLTTAAETLAAMGSDWALVGRAISIHARHGGSLATTLLSIADALEERLDLEHQRRAAVTASKLSARLLGAIGLVSSLAVITGRAGLADSLLSTTAAVVLGGLGVVWTRRLRPVVPSDHPFASRVELCASLLRGGVGVSTAMELAFEPGGTDQVAVIRLRRRVRLGAPWTRALATGDPAMRALATLMDAADGAPLHASLRTFARSLRAAQARAFELETRRAPVLLVLPLTLCFLPAFALVMLGPLLHGVTG
jgi:Flp pilus assembly protein TadB